MRRVILFIAAIFWSNAVPLSFAQDDVLKELGERYDSQQTEFCNALNAAKSAAGYDEVSLTLDPRNVFVEEFLAIEQKHRDSPAAVSALYHLMANAVGTGDPDAPASHGRVEAINILRENYIGHSDLDLLLSHLEAGAFVPQAEALLREATRSPYEHVRIAARYHLASFLRHKAQFATQYDEISQSPEADDDMPVELVEFHRKNHAIVKELGPINPVQVRAEATLLAEEVLDENTEIRLSYVIGEGPGRLSMRRRGPNEYGTQEPPTFDSLADSLLFELKHLQEGQTAPDIIGTDADQDEFRLSDYRGRVVLLMFSAGWCGPCKAMYPDIRKLQDELAHEPFTVLAVMGDWEIESVVRATEEGDIRWRSWFDGNNGPIATRWNVKSWPTLYLLDHNGVIIEDQSGGLFSDLKKSVDAALAAVKQDANAEDLLATHPVPELPILQRAQAAAALRDRAMLSLELNSGTGRSSAVAFNSNERLLVVASQEPHITDGMEGGIESSEQGKATGVVQLWDVGTRKTIRKFEGVEGAVSAVAVSPDDLFLVTAGRAHDDPNRGHLMLWDFVSGKPVKNFGEQPRSVLGAAFSPDGSLLVTGGFDKTPRIWSIPSGNEIVKLPEQPSFSDHFLFTSEGQQLVVPTRKGHVTIWDTTTWILQKQLKVDNLFLLASALSPDSRVLAVGGAPLAGDENFAERRGYTILWDLKSGEVLAEFELEDLVSGLSFSPDGKLLAAIGMGPSAVVWKWADKEIHAVIPLESRTSGSEVFFLQQTGMLMTCAQDGRLMFYDLVE